MRIGEFKRQIDQATSENGSLELDGVQIYGGQAYKVSNFQVKSQLVRSLSALGLISEDVFTKDVEEIFNEVASSDSFELGASRYNQVNAVFSHINQTLPVMRKVVAAFAPAQDEKIINVKLPSDVKSFEDLDGCNKRIGTIFAKIGITEKNGLEVVGFDTGSEWYQILIEDLAFFKWVIVVVGIAWSCIKMRKDWFDSEISRLTLKAMKKENDNKLSKRDEVVRSVMEVKITEDIEKAIDDGLPMFGKQKEEVVGQMTTAVHSVMDEIERGTEFHLSLNPPKSINEVQVGDLVHINYSDVYGIQEPNQDEVKSLEAEEENGAVS